MVSQVEPVNTLNVPLQFSQVSTMPTGEKVASNTKLRIKLIHRKLPSKSLDPESKSETVTKYPQETSRNQHSDIVQSNEKNFHEGKRLSGSKRLRAYQSNHVEMCVVKPVDPSSCKFRFTKETESKGPSHRMDSGRNRQCYGILMKLMTHQYGWMFNQPVDPVKLDIPDYFMIISKPMDLGTVKSKLEAKLYKDTREFASDIKLTFSNAMQYNPPNNYVHTAAMELNNIFISKWNIVEKKWTVENPVILESPGKKLSKQIQRSQKAYKVLRKAPSNRLKSSPHELLSSLDKQNLRSALAKMRRDTMPPILLDFLQRFGCFGQDGNRIEVDIDAFDEQTAWELHRIIQNSISANSGSGEVSGNKFSYESRYEVCAPLDTLQGHDDFCKDNSGSVYAKLQRNSSSIDTCNSRGTHQQDFDLTTSSSDIDFDRPLNGQKTAQNVGKHNLNKDENRRSTGNAPECDLICNSYPESDEGSGILDENADSSYPPAATREGEDLLYNDLSPNRALRAALLKSRFADTILKAQQKTLLNNGEKADPMKLQQEKQRLEKQHQEEKLRIEAQMKAAEVATRTKAETEKRMQREREREAARLELQRMAKTVDIDENLGILKDLEVFSSYSQFNPTSLDSNGIESDGNIITALSGLARCCSFKNPLEQLGLFIKDDDLEEEADDWMTTATNPDVEDGEIATY